MCRGIEVPVPRQAIAWFAASGPWLPARWEGVHLVPGEQRNRDRWRRYWDKASVSYDRQMQFCDRVLLGDSRPWVCAQATGHSLEVAIGTGLNLAFYPAGVELTGIDFSPASRPASSTDSTPARAAVTPSGLTG